MKRKTCDAWKDEYLTMDVYDLLELLSESPEVLADGYYREIGEVVQQRIQQVLREVGRGSPDTRSS